MSVDRYIPKKDIGKMKYKKSKIPRPNKAMSWSEILAKIQYYVEQHSIKKTVKD